MSLRNKRIFFVFIVFAVALICYFGFNIYQTKIIQEQVTESMSYWSNAIASARSNNQAVKDFVDTHSVRAAVVEQQSGSALLRETIPVDSLVCSEWSIDILLSWSGGDSSRLTMLSGECSS